MKNILIVLSVLLAVAILAIDGTGLTKPEGPRPSETEQGYWKLRNVDFLKGASEGGQSSSIGRGWATYAWSFRTKAGDGVFRTAASWTEPADRVSAGQLVTLTLNLKIEDLVWLTGGPRSLDEYLIVGIDNQPPFKDSRRNADVLVMTFDGDIVRGGGTLSVSGAFPQGRPGEALTLNVLTARAGLARYHYEWVEPSAANPPAEDPIVREGSYWELVSVEVKSCPDSASEKYTLNRGSGTYQKMDSDELFALSFSFTEPGRIVSAGQVVNISLNMKIDKYKYRGQFNHMGGSIEAGFLPGKPFAKPGDPKVWFASVSAESGAYVKQSDAVVLSGIFPPGRRNGTETFYIKTNHCATVLYHYKCTFVD